MKNIFYFIFFITLLFPTASLAVTERTEGGSMLAKITPSDPGPGEYVTVELVSYGLDLNRSIVSWQKDGQLELSGLGESKYSFSLGPLGSKAIIIATAQSPDGTVIRKTLEFNPADLEVLWEADTYVPPFYKGKALPSSESNIKLVALPTYPGKASVDPNNFSYTWKKDFRNLTGNSQAKSTLSFISAKRGQVDSIEVGAVSLDGQVTVSKTVVIPITAPKIIFYANRPLAGINYHQSITASAPPADSNLTLQAEPFYFSLPVDKSSLTYNWSINNKPATASEDGRGLAVASDPTLSGAATINLTVTSLKNFLQSASVSLKVNFNQGSFKFLP